MNFNITKKDMDAAQFNMIAEILIQISACKELLIDIYAKQENIENKEALSRIESRIDYYRKEVDQKLDADYGHIDINT